MKKKILFSLIMAAFAVAALAGCSDIITREKLEENYGNYIMVEFSLGDGGTFGGQDNVNVFYYLEPDANGTVKPVAPAETTIQPTKIGYFLEGWYPSTDFVYAEKWDFTKNTVKQNITLYAKWLPNFRYDFVYVDDKNEEHVIDSRTVSMNGTVPSTQNVTREGFTRLGYFSDRECKVPWDFTHKHEGYIKDGESFGTAEKVYTSWLEGEWVLVSSATDMLSIYNTNYYLMNDIDFSDMPWSGDTSELNGIIEGNGHKITGLNISYPRNTARVSGIFGTIGATAQIRNITFEDVTLTVDDTMGRPCSIGLLAGELKTGAKFEGVTLTGKIVLANISTNNPSAYTLGKVAGRTDTADFDGLDYSGVSVECNVNGFVLDYAADGNAVYIESATA